MTTSTERLEALRAKPAAIAGERDDIKVDIAAEGYVIKGQSILTENGQEKARWDKTTRAGRDDDAIQHIPDPRAITKIATYYDADGKATAQWIAEKPEARAQAQLWEELADRLIERLPVYGPLQEPRSAPSADHLACYPIGDHHFGMLSWRKETGASYDLDIGASLLRNAIDHLITTIRPCEQALIPVLGDFLHYDSFEAVTPTSRNPLDADGRYPKMVDVALDGVCYVIERAAEVHARVHVIIEVGNHDLSTSIFLARALAKIYRDNARITIDTSPAHFHYYEFGACLIATHHGHEVKMEGLPLVMANDRPEAWGRSRYRYWLTGHVHNSQTQMAVANKDFKGVSVESFRILAPVDAWAGHQGYRPIRDMKAIVYHRKFGEVERLTVNPQMFEEGIAA